MAHRIEVYIISRNHQISLMLYCDPLISGIKQAMIMGLNFNNQKSSFIYGAVIVGLNFNRDCGPEYINKVDGLGFYILVIPQALVLFLIYTHLPSGLQPLGSCVYTRLSTRARGITITCIYSIQSL